MNRPAGGSARAVAHSNIALAKYWGKTDAPDNRTAVPSLSLTLDALRTVTTVELDPALEADRATLDDLLVEGRPLQRIVDVLDALRARAATTSRARVRSYNSFPTASGLASSASGFAALVVAASAALGLELDTPTLSSLARASSASAARSLYGGFVALGAAADAAEPIAGADHWQVRMLVALTSRSEKPISSTEGMVHTRNTSPYYAAWLASAPGLYDEIRRGVLSRDLEMVGPAMQQSALMMHASMMAARPAVLYFTPATLATMGAVQALCAAGTPAYFTMDAGPHVKVLTTTEHAGEVEQRLRAVEGVHEVVVCAPGPAARLLADDEEP